MLTTDYGGEKHRVAINTTNGLRCDDRQPGEQGGVGHRWGIADAPYNCYDRDGNMTQRRVYMKVNQNLPGLFYRSVLGEGVQEYVV